MQRKFITPSAKPVSGRGGGDHGQPHPPGLRRLDQPPDGDRHAVDLVQGVGEKGDPLLASAVAGEGEALLQLPHQVEASALVVKRHVVGGDEQMDQADGAERVGEAEQPLAERGARQLLGVDVDHPVGEIAGDGEDLPVPALGVYFGEETGVGEEPFRLAVEHLLEAPPLMAVVDLGEVLPHEQLDLVAQRRPLRARAEKPVHQRPDEGGGAVHPLLEPFPVEAVADPVDAVGEGERIAVLPLCP